MSKSSARKGTREKHRKATSKTAKSPRAGRKTTRKIAAEKVRHTTRKTNGKIAAEKGHHIYRKATETKRDTHSETAAQFVEIRPAVPTLMRVVANHSQFDEVRATQGPESVQAAIEKSIEKTHDLCRQSLNSVQLAIQSWEDSLDAAGQGAMALSRKIIDITERNLNSGFDLATSLAGAKSLIQAMELHSAYWRKQFGELRMQAEELRAVLEKVASSVAEPIKTRVTRGTD
jgi:hypothetical protein